MHGAFTATPPLNQASSPDALGFNPDFISAINFSCGTMDEYQVRCAVTAFQSRSVTHTIAYRCPRHPFPISQREAFASIAEYSLAVLLDLATSDEP